MVPGKTTFRPAARNLSCFSLLRARATPADGYRMRKLATIATMVVLIGLAAALFAGCNDDADKAYMPPFIGVDPATGGQPVVLAPDADPATDPVQDVAALPPAVTAPPVAGGPACAFNGRVTRGCNPAQIKSICNDGTGSCSTGPGTCSGHGGVCVTL